MSFIAEFMIIEIWFLLIGMAAIIIYKLTTGRINLKGLLCEKNMANKFPGPIAFGFSCGGVLLPVEAVQRPDAFPDGQFKSPSCLGRQ
jgi:hypothetical protein